MAGAGYRLFNTGDVLTAAQVNTFLQEQVVMRFANAAARTTALSGVLAEGMVSYLDDTNTIEVYNGSAWVNVGNTGDITGVTAGTGISGGGTSGDVTITNSMATAINAKGDLIAGTANDTFDRLAVGSNGETLVADSSASTGLRWQGNFAAGKNALINGDFRINQRNFTSLTNVNTGSYSFDRWSFVAEGSTGSGTLTPQTFTAGSAPVAGYEAINFAQIVTASMASADCRSNIRQAIEDVRTFANQTITISFWARAASGTPKMAIEVGQNFGTGGSTSVNTYAGQVTLSTSWARYSVTVTVPSISGKTVGTSSALFIALYVSAGSNFDSRTGTLGNQNNTFSIWGVQAEAGNVATAFQTATGTLAGELAACQRYYWRQTATSAYSRFGLGFGTSGTNVNISFFAPVTMRVQPTSVDFGNIAQSDTNAGVIAVTAVTLNDTGNQTIGANCTTTSATQFRPAYLLANNNTAAFIGFNAEL